MLPTVAEKQKSFDLSVTLEILEQELMGTLLWAVVCTVYVWYLKHPVFGFGSSASLKDQVQIGCYVKQTSTMASSTSVQIACLLPGLPVP